MLNRDECEYALRCSPYDGSIEARKCAEILEQLIEEHFVMLDKLKKGDLSDGYHTYNELYHHRAVLFSVIVNQNKSISWKSKKHHDGTMYDGMFIVGIDTPQGQYSYHYDIEPYWNMFECKELDNAPEWDGHKPKDIDRLLSIDDNPPLKFEELKEGMWVWDNKMVLYIRIAKIIGKTIYAEDFLYGFDCYGRYEENRFYRKKVKE